MPHWYKCQVELGSTVKVTGNCVLCGKQQTIEVSRPAWESFEGVPSSIRTFLIHGHCELCGKSHDAPALEAARSTAPEKIAVPAPDPNTDRPANPPASAFSLPSLLARFSTKQTQQRVANRVICPPRPQLDHLRTPLTDGERRVLDFFDRWLPAGWEIYIQPHLNGLRPDFVLLHPKVGIAVFEVKDWDLSAMRYFTRYEAGEPRLWCEDRAGQEFRQRDNPVEKVVHYKREILNLYCPRLGIRTEEVPQIMSVVTAGVIMTKSSTASAEDLFLDFRKHLQLLGDKADYHPLAGADALDAEGVGRVFPWGRNSYSKFMEPRLADDLRGWLVEPDHAAAQRDPLPLDDRQRQLVLTRPEGGYRRIRGAAGSGKSLVIAARAAQLSAEGKEVLVVSFNITLLHYLRDLAVRYPDPRKSIIARITWLHFHDWCKTVCQEAGMAADYRALFGGFSRVGEEYDEGENDLFEIRLPQLAGRAVAEGGEAVSRFDAVLVDEGQDFSPLWWNLLRRIVRPGGEMVLAMDSTQDLYGQSIKWLPGSMAGQDTGFTGRWVDLGRSYRFPPAFVPYLEHFVEAYLPSGERNFPTAAQGELFASEQPLHLRWMQVKEADEVKDCVTAVRDLAAGPSPAVPWSDITMLVGTHEFGLRCVAAFENLRVNVAHVFGEDHRSRKRRKLGFWMGDGRMKAATVHSFKGWESRAMVIHISRAATPNDLAAVYVALSRLRKSEKGSYMTVVCSAPELENYGRTWPMFARF